MSEEKLIAYLKNIALPLFVVLYFVRYIFPQGVYSHTLTALFFYFTVYIVLGGLVIAGLYGTVEILKSRKNKSEITAKNKSFIGSAIVGLILFSISSFTHEIYLHKKFDSELWKNTKVSMDFDANLLTPRQRMMEDLVENHLTGLTKIEVVSLLGVPNYSWESDEGGIVISYIVGPEKGLGVDSQCLEIHFDENYKYQGYTDVPICG